MIEEKIYIDNVANIVYLKTPKGTIPIGMNYDKETGNFENIENIPYLQTFIEFVIRSRQSFDPVRKLYKYKELFPYQWSACLVVIDSVMKERGDRILPIFSRQCLRKGTLVENKNGELKKIEDMELSFCTNKSADIYKVSIKGGYELFITNDHPLQGEDNLFYPLYEFKVGDKVRVLKQNEKGIINKFDKVKSEYYKKYFLENGNKYYKYFALTEDELLEERQILNKLGIIGSIKNEIFYRDFDLKFENERLEDTGEITFLSEIESIELIGKDEVYDLEVPDKEWFIANGVKVHNCGKSESIKVYLPYLTVFARRYIDFIHERFSSILGSYKEDTIEKLRKEVLPFYKVAISTHNDIYKDVELVANFDNKHLKLTNNNRRIEIAVLLNGEYLPYSETFFITMGVSQDSLTSHLTVIDEAGKVSNELFDNSVAPFSNSTGGTQVFIGVPSTDPTSLLQQKYYLDGDERPKKYFYDWRKCYSLAKLINPKQAEIMKNSCLKDMSNSGGTNSITNRMNYYLEFTNAQGVFLNKDIIEKHDMFCLIDNDLSVGQGLGRKYRVAGIDISATSTGDYFVISRGLAWQDDYGIYRSEIKRINTINQDKSTLILPNEKIDIICNILESENIDICIMDATSQQLHFVQFLKKAMDERGIRTMLIPYQYNAKSKQVLFSTWEEALYSGYTKFPVRNFSWESQKLYEEMLTLIKEETTTGVTYHAYRSKRDLQSQQNTDDHCNAVAMLHYALQYLDLCIVKGTWFSDGANPEWRAERYHVEDIYNKYKGKNSQDRNSDLTKVRNWLERLP